MLINKGKGASVALPYDADVDCMLFFTIKDKPELNLQLETPQLRDAAVEGFNYVIQKRLGNAGQIKNASFVGNAEKATGGLKILFITWAETKIGGLLSSKYVPRLLILTHDKNLSVMIPPNNSRKDQPEDFSRELRKYFSGRWNNDILTTKGYSVENVIGMDSIQAVGVNAKDSTAIELVAPDKPIPFRFTDSNARRTFFEFMEGFTRKLRRGF